MNTKRSIKFKFINAVLKLNHEILAVGAFPQDALLRAHVRDIRAENTRAAQAVRADGSVVGGYVNDMMYRQRFNLSAADVDLMRKELTGAGKAPRSFEHARSIYFRQLLEPGKVYAFMSLQQRTPNCFYVAESKSFAGKDAAGEGEAEGRFVSVAWFEADRPLGDDVIVMQANRGHHLELQTLTVAELLRTAGHYEAVAEQDSARDQERKLENAFLNFNLSVFPNAKRILGDVGGEATWTFELTGDSADIETHFFAHQDHTKMTKLQMSRYLIVTGRAQHGDWQRLSLLNKVELATRCLAPLP